jgi:excisionase family DNA binding protein
MPNAFPADRSHSGKCSIGDRTVRKKNVTTASATDHLGQRLAYSVDEAATVTGLSRDLLYDQMRTGKLGYLKVGRRRIITIEHLAAFLALPSV